MSTGRRGRTVDRFFYPFQFSISVSVPFHCFTLELSKWSAKTIHGITRVAFEQSKLSLLIGELFVRSSRCSREKKARKIKALDVFDSLYVRAVAHPGAASPTRSLNGHGEAARCSVCAHDSMLMAP